MLCAKCAMTKGKKVPLDAIPTNSVTRHATLNTLRKKLEEMHGDSTCSFSLSLTLNMPSSMAKGVNKLSLEMKLSSSAIHMR